MNALSTHAPATRQFQQLPPWSWSLLGVIFVWISVISISSGSPLAPLGQALSIAPYLVLVGLGQMLVMTLGPGNIDVSVAAVISLASYASVAISSFTGSMLLGLLGGAMAGVAAAAVSVLAILLLRVPPIIATLATSLIAASATLILSDSSSASAATSLRTFVNARLLGVPVLALVIAVLTVLIAVSLKRTTYGVSVIAVGQSLLAARKAGLPVNLTIASTYLISGALAGITGTLLGAFISPNTGIGSSYLLDSVAVVVIGGTLVAGGRPVPSGLWTGAMFLILLSGLMNMVGWSIGAQNILKGILVVLVVVISGTATSSGRAHAAKLFTRKNKPDLGAQNG